MQKQKAGKRKIYVFAVGMILLFLIGKYSGWSGRLLNGDLTQALQHITVENLPAAIFIYLVVTAVGSVAFALPGISFAILAGLLFGPVLGTICCTVVYMSGKSSFDEVRYVWTCRQFPTLAYLIVSNHRNCQI